MTHNRIKPQNLNVTDILVFTNQFSGTGWVTCMNARNPAQQILIIKEVAMEVDDLIASIEHNEKEITDLAANSLALHEAIIDSNFKKINDLLKHHSQLILARAQNNNLLFFEVMSRNQKKQMGWLIRHGMVEVNASNLLQILIKKKRANVFDRLAYEIMSYSSSLAQDSLEAKIIDEVMLVIPYYYDIAREFLKISQASELAYRILSKARCLKLIEDKVNFKFNLPNELKSKILLEYEANPQVLLPNQINKIMDYANTPITDKKPEDYLKFIGIRFPNQLEFYQVFHTLKYHIVKTLLKNPVYCHTVIIESFQSCLDRDMDELLIEVFKLEKKFPHYSDSAYLETMIMTDQGEKDYAKLLFKQIVCRDDKQPNILYFRIKALEQLEMYQEALREIDNALPHVRESREKFDLLLVKVSILRNTKDYEAALETLNHVISHPSYTIKPYDYLLKAILYEDLGAKILAHFNYKQAWDRYLLKINDSYFSDCKNSLAVLRKLKSFDETFKNGQDEMEKAEGYCQQKLYIQALPLLQQAEKYNKTEKIYYLLAMCYYHTNQMSECLEAIMNAFIAEPAKLLGHNRTVLNMEAWMLDCTVKNIETWLIEILEKLSKEDINQKLSKLLSYEYKLFILVIGQIILRKYTEKNVNIPQNNAAALTTSIEEKQSTTLINNSSAQLIHLHSVLFGSTKRPLLQSNDNQSQVGLSLNVLFDDYYENQLLCFKPF